MSSSKAFLVEHSAVRPAARLLAHAGGLLFLVAGVLGMAALAFPGGSGSSAATEVLTSLLSFALGALLWLFGEHLPALTFQLLAGAATALTAVSAYYGGNEGWLNGFYFFWIALFAAYFFSSRWLAAQLVLIAASYGLVAAAVSWPDAWLIWFLTIGTAVPMAVVFAFLRRRLERALFAERGQVARLEELDQLRSDFLATVSHELRTPVTAVYGATATLKERDLEPARRQQLLDLAHAQAERLAELTEDILQSTAVERGRIEVSLGPVEPEAAVEEAAAAARLRAPGRIIAFHPSRVATVVADPLRLSQVMANLLDNAIKYSPASEATVVTVEADDDRVKICVSDRGPGVPEGEREQVFDKFHRLDANMHHGVGGSGLGLFIARGLVEAMEGTIWLEPRDGGGTTAVVSLCRFDSWRRGQCEPAPRRRDESAG